MLFAQPPPLKCPYKPIIAYFLSLLTCLICGNSLVFAIGIPFVITNYFCGDKPIYAALNAARSTASTTSGVCLDFPKFFAVKMRSTLKSYFLGGCGEDLRRCTVRTSSKDLPEQAKKTTLRLDRIRFLLGIRINRFITVKINSDKKCNA